MRSTSKTNSKPHENTPLRRAYLDAHPVCLLCRREPATQVHHIRRGIHRWDVNANLAALCFTCHMVDGHDKDNAALMIRCLFAKWKIDELDVAGLDALGGERLAGWLERNKPTTGVLLSMWWRVNRECEVV